VVETLRDESTFHGWTKGMVCDKEQEVFIGTTGLYSINWIMRAAEFRVFIGNKAFWNRGIGTECTKLMVVYGLEKLNLNRIWLGVNADNLGGVHAYEKAGFVREGVLRQEQYRNFRYYDVIRMSILRTEYEKIREGYLARDRETA
jgi:RimJ/RimL family protein N-acetyltransferase